MALTHTTLQTSNQPRNIMTDGNILFSLLDECKQFLERQFGQDLVLPIYQWIVPCPKNRAQLIEWVNRWKGDPSSIADPIGFWDTSEVTDFSEVFSAYRNRKMKRFDEELHWDLSNATNTNHMFYGCKAFRGRGLKKWVVSGVTNMNGMFCHCKSFDEDLSQWDTSSATGMSFMFYECHALDADLSRWNVRRCTDVQYMFCKCHSFNRDCISQWILPDGTFGVTLMFAF